MAKKLTLHNADRWFSIYIRLRDADEEGNITCCSCGKKIYWRDADAGHFIPRQHRSTRYYEKNVHGQCRKCNRFDNGCPAGYAQFLINQYGKNILESLMVVSHQQTRWTRFEVDNIAAEFKKRATQLAKQKGIIL